MTDMESIDPAAHEPRGRVKGARKERKCMDVSRMT
jgi:hypothetical protein